MFRGKGWTVGGRRSVKNGHFCTFSAKKHEIPSKNPVGSLIGHYLQCKCTLIKCPYSLRIFRIEGRRSGGCQIAKNGKFWTFHAAKPWNIILDIDWEPNRILCFMQMLLNDITIFIQDVNKTFNHLFHMNISPKPWSVWPRIDLLEWSYIKCF